VTLILLPFYVTFLMNELIAGVLYGLGRTDLLAVSSLAGRSTRFQILTKKQPKLIKYSW
jgi:hypothetical protein